jgi:lipoprotein NlpD
VIWWATGEQGRMWPRRVASAGAGVVLVLVLTAGCGGGDNKSAPTTVATTASTAPPTTAPAGTTAPPATTAAPTVGTDANGEYTIQKGDTLSKIAKQFGTSVAAIVTLNNLENPDKIAEGQRLKIPPPTPATSAAPAPGAPTTAKPATAPTTAPAAPTTTAKK